MKTIFKMKTIYSVTYQVSGEEIKSLGVFNSIDEARDAIALHEAGGSFDDCSAVDLEKLTSDINYQLDAFYDNSERLFHSEGDVEYHVHEWQVEDDFTIESDMFEVIHLEVLPCDEIHESIGITHDRSYCSNIILGCEKTRRENNGEPMNIKDKTNLMWEMDLVIEDRDKFFFDDDEGDVCYYIVTHKFSNEK